MAAEVYAAKNLPSEMVWIHADAAYGGGICVDSPDKKFPPMQYQNVNSLEMSTQKWWGNTAALCALVTRKSVTPETLQPATLGEVPSFAKRCILESMSFYNDEERANKLAECFKLKKLAADSFKSIEKE